MPELDQRAEGRARRDERGRGARIVLLLIDDAHAAGLQIGNQPVEAVGLDRQMMHPLAVPLDKLGDEAGLAGRVLDQFDDKPAEMEILPVERAADLLVLRFRAAQFDRKIFREEIVSATIDFTAIETWSNLKRTSSVAAMLRRISLREKYALCCAAR